MTDVEKIVAAQRLLGYALFNAAKGKHAAVETLISKAYAILTDENWDQVERVALQPTRPRHR